MIGTLLALVGTFIQEMSASFGKRMLEKQELSFSLYGITSYFFAAVFFLGFALLNNETISLARAGLLTFFARFVFEIIQAEIQFRALKLADRSTFGFLRTLTIPLLLIVDVVLGYTLSAPQLFGVLIVTIVLLIVFVSPRANGKGALLSLLSAVNAVVTISLYKYDITHFHSVASEQFYMTILLVGYFSVRSFMLHGRSMFHILVAPKVVLQSGATGLGSILVSYAYLYGPASLILAVLRSSSVFWSFLSGAIYFKETHVRSKLIMSSLLIVALFFIIR